MREGNQNKSSDKKDWKVWLKQQKGKKDQWLIVILVGILLLVIAIPTSTAKKDSGSKETVTTAQQSEDTDSYARLLERRLEEALTQVQGVGKVSVMITLSSSAEKVVEKDRETSSDTSTDGENGTSQSSSSAETSVYSGESGSGTPYIKKELTPDIKGVMVIADGGDNAVVIENITEAVQALFGVDTHKIKVMKRN